jgi:hypothetical protein
MMTDSNTEFGGIQEVFGADKGLQANGMWTDYGNISIKLAFAGKANPRYEIVLEKKTQPIKRYLNSTRLQRDPEIRRQIEHAMIAVYAEVVVLDWKGVTRGGKSLKYSSAEGKKAMIEFPALWEFIREYANELENYQAEDLEEDSKNS